MPKSPPTPEPDASTDGASLETLTARITEIVESLESATLPLNEAVAAYTEGMAAIRRAQQRLDEAEQQVRLLEADSDEDDYAPPEI